MILIGEEEAQKHIGQIKNIDPRVEGAPERMKRKRRIRVLRIVINSSTGSKLLSFTLLCFKAGNGKRASADY